MEHVATSNTRTGAMVRISLHDWKTSAAGILTTLMASSTAITAFLASQASLTPSHDLTAAKWSGAFALITSLCRIWLGFVQKDA